MQIWLQNLIFGLLGSGITAIIGALVVSISSKVKKGYTLLKAEDKAQFLSEITSRLDSLEPMRQAVLSLLRENLKQEMKEHIKANVVTLEDKEKVLKDYKLYKEMKGNGYLDICKKAFDDLRVIP